MLNQSNHVSPAEMDIIRNESQKERNARWAAQRVERARRPLSRREQVGLFISGLAVIGVASVASLTSHDREPVVMDPAKAVELFSNPADIEESPVVLLEEYEVEIGKDGRDEAKKMSEDRETYLEANPEQRGATFVFGIDDKGDTYYMGFGHEEDFLPSDNEVN